jgi:paraquat-inducible protein A
MLIDNKDLDNLIFCRKCGTLHKKIDLEDGKVAKCSQCGVQMYRNSKNIFHKTFAFSITSLILFVVANIYPIMNVIIAGESRELTIIGMIYTLFKEGFVVVGAIILVVLVLSPLLVMLSYIIIGFLTTSKQAQGVVKMLMIFLTRARDWAMIDIFLVSILVALVKLIGYATIKFDIAFVALILFIIVDALTLKSIKPVELWQYYKRVYE